MGKTERTAQDLLEENRRLKERLAESEKRIRHLEN